MAFKIRYNGYFTTQLFLIKLFLLLFCLNFFWPFPRHDLSHYNYIFYALTAVALAIQIYRPIYAAITHKPILTVNDEYIYDFNFDIRYEWKDVEEFYEKNGLLYVNLYHPENYLNKIGNPHRRFVAKLWFKPERKKSLFIIKTDMIDEDGNDLLEILDDYSVKAMANAKQ